MSLANELLRVVNEDPNDVPVKPWQRLACLLYVSGTPLEDVAKELNQNLVAVTSFTTSPRGIALMKALVTENPERMDTLIEATVIDSIMKMVRVRDLGKTENAQLTAAGQLLDRFLPKAKAKDLSKNRATGGFTDVEKEIERLRTELKASVD